MATIISVITWVVSTLFAIVVWVIGKLFWIILWLVLPLVILAFIALRVAESVLGQEAVRTWVKARSLKYGGAAWIRARRLLFALGVLPVRVLAWFAVYAVWHSIVSLLWRPKWHPWRKAWSKRWKKPKTTRSGRPVKTAAGTG